MIYKRNLILSFLMLLVISAVHSENIRGPMAGIIQFDGIAEETVKANIESLVAVTLSESLSPLIQGLKLTISGPEGLSLYRNSFALYFYENLDNTPVLDQMSYRGTQSYMRFMDFEKNISFLIPLSENHTMSPDRSSYIVSEDNKGNDFPLLFTILPITKGIPNSIYQEEISFTLTPVYFEKGSLQLNVFDNQGNPVDENLYFQIDGNRIQDLSEPVIFETGLHTLIIRTDSGIEETLQFSLSPGESLILDHILQLQYPTLRIDTIDGMKVFLDGKLIEESVLAQSFEIEPGKHVIRFEIGDYQLSREFNAEMQDSYRITMIPEIQLEKQQ